MSFIIIYSLHPNSIFKFLVFSLSDFPYDYFSACNNFIGKTDVANTIGFL